MQNMKTTPAQAKDMAEPAMAEAPKYPYGLRVTLEDDALAKLDLPARLTVGQSMMLHARVEICNLEERQNLEGGSHRSMTLQITDLALEPEESDPVGRLKELYKK